MRAGAYFAIATALLFLLAYPLLRLGFGSPAEGVAIRLSAAAALSAQIVTFAIARLAAQRNMMIGWGLGAVLRLLVLVLFALLVVPALGLPQSAALISLVVFLFLSMLVEPFLLAYDR